MARRCPRRVSGDLRRHCRERLTCCGHAGCPFRHQGDHHFESRTSCETSVCSRCFRDAGSSHVQLNDPFWALKLPACEARHLSQPPRALTLPHQEEQRQRRETDTRRCHRPFEVQIPVDRRLFLCPAGDDDHGQRNNRVSNSCLSSCLSVQKMSCGALLGWAGSHRETTSGGNARHKRMGDPCAEQGRSVRRTLSLLTARAPETGSVAFC